MNELLKKFPELIKSLLDKISQVEMNCENPEVKAAREKLLNKLKSINDDVAKTMKG